jgi:ERCC4-type nuclease
MADLFETESGVPRRLHALGVTVEVRALPVGDYAMGPVLLERKTVADLHRSVREGRLWPQLGRLRRATRFPYLLIEGRDLDHGALRPRSVRGACLAAAELGITVVRSADRDDSASWLQLLAERVSRDRLRLRPRYAQRPKPPPERAGEAMLAAVPGVGPVRARALLREFGCVARPAASPPEAFLSVPGIGPVGAAALATALGLDRHRS